MGMFIQFSKNRITLLLLLFTVGCDSNNENTYNFGTCDMCLTCKDSSANPLDMKSPNDVLTFLDTSTYIYSSCLHQTTLYLYEKTGIEPNISAGFGGYYYKDAASKEEDIKNWRKALDNKSDRHF